MSFSSNYYELKKKKKEEPKKDIAPLYKNKATAFFDRDIAPVGSSKKTETPKRNTGGGSFSKKETEKAPTEQELLDKMTPTERMFHQKVGGFSSDVAKDNKIGIFTKGKPLYATQRDANALDLTLNSIKRGYYTSRLGEESFAAMNGEANEKAVIEQILGGEDYQFKTRGMVEQGISGWMEMGGQMARQFTHPRTLALTGSAAGAAAIAGQAGPQVIAPEELVTVPAAAAAGFAAGNAASALEIEAGLAYNEMVEAGIKEETARKIALGVGTINASLEAFQVDELVDAYRTTKGLGTKKFTQRIIEELLERGVDVAKETAQEVLQEGVTIAGVQAGSKFDTGEKVYTKEEVKKRLLDTAKSSALSFGMMNVPATVKNTVSISADTNKTTKLTENEQKVVDKVVENRIAEKEETGTKLTAKEKADIQKQVRADLEKGYISTDTIEEVLGDKTSYNALQQEANEFNALYTMESGKMTRQQQVRLAELEAKNEANPYETAVQTEKDKVSQGVFELVKDSRLAESYNERTRRGQKFEADLSKYDEKQRETVQKAIDSGILNNSNRTHEFVDIVSKISADKGVPFDFANNEKIKETGFAVDGMTVDGYVSENGITINIDSPRAWQSTVGHEVTHIQEGTDLYDELKTTLFDYAKSKGEYQSRYDSIVKRYKEGTDYEAELTADLVGDYLFQDTDFVKKLSVEHRNVFQKIYDEVKYLSKVVTAGSKEARDLEKVRKAFEEAYRAETKRPIADHIDSLGVDADRVLDYDSTVDKLEGGVNSNEQREETRESFYRRANEEKYTVRERGKVAIGYSPVTDKTGCAGRAEKALQELGIPVIVHEGLEANIDGVTRGIQGEASSVAGDAVYVRNSIKTDPIETAGHEAFHFWKNTDARLAYMEIVTDNIDFSSNAFVQFQERIAKKYFGEEVGIEDNGADKLSEELFAYIAGLVYAGDGNNIVRPFLRDYDAVKAAWDALVETQARTPPVSQAETNADLDELAPIGSVNFSGKDLILETPTAENAEGVFFDDLAPVQSELDKLNQEKEAFDSLVETADQYAPIAEQPTAPVVEDVAPAAAEKPIAPVKEQHEAIKPKTEPKVKADSVEQKTAKVLTEDPQTPKQKSAWNWVKEHIFRHGAVIEDIALETGNRELQAKFDNIRRAEGMAQEMIGKGNGNAKSLIDIWNRVESSGKLESFQNYLYHMLNIDRMTLEQRYNDVPNKAVFGDDVTAETSQKYADRLLKNNPEFRVWAQQCYDYCASLRQDLVDGGVISQELSDKLAEMYPHYVPIGRVDKSGKNIDVPLDTKKTGVNTPIKRATGGNSDIRPVFKVMAERTIQTYKAIAKNSFGVELKNTLGTVIDSEAYADTEVQDSVAQHEELLQEGKNGQSPTFTVFENGEKVTFEITDDIYEALKPSQFTYTNKTLNKIGNIRRDTLTTFSPSFPMTNPFKDMGDIIVNSQHPVRTYAEIPEAAWQLISKGNWYQERTAHGGSQDTYFSKRAYYDSKTKDFRRQSTLGKVAGFPFEKIRQANEFIEQVPRLAEYIASRKAGRSIDVSMLDSARVTTNFGAAGDFTNMLNRNGFTFLGASVEGFNQQVRNGREAKAEGVKGWAKLAGKYLVAGLPVILLNHALWDDDEDYEELSDYVKQNYYIVGKFGDGQFVRIPKGRAVAVIQNAFEQMENLITGNDEVDLKTFADLVFANLAPNDPLNNNVLSPVFQTLNNRTWYGEDLVPTRLQDLPAAEQYDESTDSISRWLGEKAGEIGIDISPVKVNYLLDQYSGGVGDMLLPMITPEAESGDNSFVGNMIAPLKDKFTTDSTMNNKNVSDFYDTMDKLTTNAKSSKATDEDILKSKYINSVSAELSDLYKRKREIQNSGYSDSYKYEMVRDVQRQIDDLAEESLVTYENVRIQGDYATVGDRRFLKKDGSWTKLSEEQLAKESKVTSALGISGSEYWSNKDEYDFAYESPGKYAVAKSVGGYDAYKTYSGELFDIKADKDENGKSINGSRKEKVIDYINNLDADYGERIILFKSEYPSDDTYNYEIIDYLNSRQDISYDEMVTILKELGFNVDSSGNITWD